MGDVCPASYIRMVQNLIERCLLFHMNQEDCVETLSRVANIKPVITTVVWKELEKNNEGFFRAYYRHTEDMDGPHTNIRSSSTNPTDHNEICWPEA